LSSAFTHRFRPLHDALIEDALDNAALALGAPLTAAPWSAWMRLCRGALGVSRAVHRRRHLPLAQMPNSIRSASAPREEQESSIPGMTQTLAFSTAGSPEARTRILLIHGLAVDGTMFVPLSATMTRAGWFVLSPDLRGFGRSAAYSGPFTIAQHANDLADLLATFSPGSWLVLGYSQGGSIAQQLARTHPDQVAALVLCNAYARNIASVREWCEALALAVLASTVDLRRLAPLLWDGLAAQDAVDPAARERFIAMVCRTHRAALRQMVRELRHFDSRPWLHELTCPALLIRGANDRAVPAHHLIELQRYLPYAEQRELVGVGHAMAWSAPEPLGRAIIEWWTARLP
jgi:pimeloyl-ACP methyl ester carboxylesterase